MQRLVTVLLVFGAVMAPVVVTAADLVVWWDEGYYPEEREAVAEIIEAFEDASGKRVELVRYPQEEIAARLQAAVEAGDPPDLAYGLWLLDYFARWAQDDRLVDLVPVLGDLTDLFDPDALDYATRLNGVTGRRALYGLPMGISSHYLHVWVSLLEEAGFTLDDIPGDWHAFWSFWCDEVQPAVRAASGRDDIWGIGADMSPTAADGTVLFLQFLAAYEADYVAPDGRLLVDDPEIRDGLVRAIENYASIYRKGCTPPGSLSWSSGADNNRAFLDQTVVMTPNPTLSIPNALKSERPQAYSDGTATIPWPRGPHGNVFPIFGDVILAMIFKGRGSVGLAELFVRFLVAEGWLAHYINFSGERYLPPLTAIREQPFWQDPADRHRMAAVVQVASRPLATSYTAASGDWRHDQIIFVERVWTKAIARVVTDDLTPEQAVDEAIARIKEILDE
jgi:multiple sugar transport system substrate-binding protein